MSAPSLPPPQPKSPPEHPRWFVRRREMANVQMVEREVEFLQEELKSAQIQQPASRCCKEIVDFVTAKSDPFLPSKARTNRRRFPFWKSLFSCSGTSHSVRPTIRRRGSRSYSVCKWRAWINCLVPNRRRCGCHLPCKTKFCRDDWWASSFPSISRRNGSSPCCEWKSVCSTLSKLRLSSFTSSACDCKTGH